ncbi:MAG TPA: 30S ribosomal protein S2, partial [Rhodoglobus sp.]|nr:30S ribosomal protein S2 [Rhodoglobus sp.]
NDDAIRSVGLLTRIIADAAAEGLIQRHQKPEEGAEVEPLAAWEAELLQASETPVSEAEKIEAVDGEISGTPDAAAVAEVIAAEVPVEENDADALVAEHEAAADATVVPEHHVESDEATEAKIEAEATADEKKPAAKKPAAK